jgi:hypothetical protein
MATTVGQHGVTAFTNPSNGDALDATVVKGNDNTLREAYVDHDSDPGIHVQSSALALRPAAGSTGRKWMTYDGTSPRLWYDDGTAWREISYLSSSPTSATFSGTVSAAVVTAGQVISTGTAQTGSLQVSGLLDVTNASWHIQTLRLVYAPNTISWSGSVTSHLTPLNFISLTGNATVTLSNPLSTYTAMYMAAISQDGVGGRTLAFTNVLFPGGTTPTQTTTANKTDLWLFIAKDNTTFYGVRLAANL